MVVSFGGGSNIDATKAAEVLRTLGGLDPVKKRMARSQLKSAFVDALLGGMKSSPMRWLTRI